MQVSYTNSRMAKLATNPKALRLRYGQNERNIRKCIETLKAVPNLAELFKPAFRRFRCHLLRNNKRGIYSLDVKDPYRLLFMPTAPVPMKKDDVHAIDEESVEAVVVVELSEDTHV